MPHAQPAPTIALVSCSRKHIYEIGPNLLALSLAAPGARVLLYADAPGREVAADCLDYFRAHMDITVLPIDALGAPLPDYNESPFTKGVQPKQVSKFACASAKLMLQGAPALRESRFVLALDIDTVVNEPLAPSLWRPWSNVMEHAGSLWGLVQESGDDAPLTFGTELRDVRPSTIARAAYFNTGVILLHAQRLRARNLTHPSTLLAQLSLAARQGKSRYDEFGLGEQNLLNAWLAERPELVSALPCRWNRRIDRPCDDAKPGIRHANRMLAKPRDANATDARLKALLAGPLPPLEPPPVNFVFPGIDSRARDGGRA